MSEGANTGAAVRRAGNALEPASAIGEVAMPAELGSNRRKRRRIVVLGEFNSGKTTLVNALVGTEVLMPSVIANTACPTVVAFAAKPSLLAETAGRKRMPMSWDIMDGIVPECIRRLHIGVPLERLKALSVIDTPGLGFADEDGELRSRQACRHADVAIWCTPAMQAWKASEERVWLALPRRVRDRGVLAVTFADEITEADTTRLLARLRAEAGSYFRKIVTADACPALVLAESERGHGREQRRGVSAPRTGAALASAQVR